MYNSKYYTCEQIDQRLLEGYYDDAVAAGYTGSKTQYLAGLLKAINYAANPTLTADKVVYNQAISGLTSKNVQAAIDELANKKADKKETNSLLAEKANTADVDAKFTEEKKRVDAELAKKFDKASVAQEPGESEDKVMSQKAVSDKLSDLLKRGYIFKGIATANTIPEGFNEKVFYIVSNFTVPLDNFGISDYNMYPGRVYVIVNDLQNKRWNIEPIELYAYDFTQDFNTRNIIGWKYDNSREGYQLSSYETSINPITKKGIYVEFGSFVNKVGVELYDRKKRLLGFVELINNHFTHIDYYDSIAFCKIFINTSFGITKYIKYPYLLGSCIVKLNLVSFCINNYEYLESLSSYNSFNSACGTVNAGKTKEFSIQFQDFTGTGTDVSIKFNTFNTGIICNCKLYDINAINIKNFKIPYIGQYVKLIVNNEPSHRQRIRLIVFEITAPTDTDIKVEIYAEQHKSTCINLSKSKFRKKILQDFGHTDYYTSNIKKNRKYVLINKSSVALDAYSAAITNDIKIEEVSVEKTYRIGHYEDNVLDSIYYSEFIPDKDYGFVGSINKKGLELYEEITDEDKIYGEEHSVYSICKANDNNGHIFTCAKNPIKAGDKFCLMFDTNLEIFRHGFSVSTYNDAGLVEEGIAITRNLQAYSSNDNKIYIKFIASKDADGFKFYVDGPTENECIRFLATKNFSLHINPQLFGDCSDPTIIFDRNSNIKYVLGSPWQFKDYKLRFSYNGEDWIDGDYPFDDSVDSIFSKYTSGIWAPSSFYINGEYYIYSGIVKNASISSIGIFKSKNPFGKYSFIKEIVPSSETGIIDTIDPYVVYGEDNNLYMFYGSTGNIHRVRLSDDGLSVLDSPVLVVKNGNLPYRNDSYEGVYLYYRCGYWYMFVSVGNFNTNYRLCVGRSKTITGEFLNENGERLLDSKTTVILEGTNSNYFYSPGHNGEIVEENGKTYMYFHGVSNINYGEFNSALGRIAKRQLFKQEILWKENGFPYFEDKTIKNAYVD